MLNRLPSAFAGGSELLLLCSLMGLLASVSQRQRYIKYQMGYHSAFMDVISMPLFSHFFGSCRHRCAILHRPSNRPCLCSEPIRHLMDDLVSLVARVPDMTSHAKRSSMRVELYLDAVALIIGENHCHACTSQMLLTAHSTC